MTAASAMPAIEDAPSLFARALETDRTYFELGARVASLPGAVLAWMPGLTASPAAAVIHRVDADAIAAIGESWIVEAERSLVDVGARLARIYLDSRDTAADAMLRRSGFVARDELVFVHSLPDPLGGLSLRPVLSDRDWEYKLRLHEAAQTTPDGHGHHAHDWVALERRKCEAGMEAFLAEADGETVGAVGAMYGDGILRFKNLVVHPDHRRRSVGMEIIRQLAALGRERGVSQQCAYAVKGEPGERLYRAAGMPVAGTQVEWSKRIGEPLR